MADPFDVLMETARLHRLAITEILRSLKGREDVIPLGWNNNARWHAGHLVLTPHLLTLARLGEPMIVPEEYRQWFAKGTGPADWGAAPIPAYDDLVDQIVPSSVNLHEALRGRLEEPFQEPYVTSVGAKLTCPLDALTLSGVHDGIHLGLLLALRRALG
jgi:hypothetical protein